MSTRQKTREFLIQVQSSDLSWHDFFDKLSSEIDEHGGKFTWSYAPWKKPPRLNVTISIGEEDPTTSEIEITSDEDLLGLLKIMVNQSINSSLNPKWITKTYQEDLNLFRECICRSYSLLMRVTSFRDLSKRQMTAWRILFPAGKNLIAATKLCIAGLTEEACILLRHVMERIAIAFAVIQKQEYNEKLPTLKESLRTIKRVIPDFGRRYGVLSNVFAHPKDSLVSEMADWMESNGSTSYDFFGSTPDSLSGSQLGRSRTILLNFAFILIADTSLTHSIVTEAALYFEVSHKSWFWAVKDGGNLRSRPSSDFNECKNQIEKRAGLYFDAFKSFFGATAN